ncbi:hypothetical protein D477_000435 [Arthrobacter crystallopoietes BAB-32]|uniref:DUF4245 domain-containing protein n=1 Tax=Arthrobacter crystallopoietes BAB-32 TaxID=1246476 RepID=N1V4A7_9MICC|nr:DUF4245 domain-containing protein [Arthrobacter crystallopoietes]EMY36180.1 hypothetical protein D477_000435 [Arthrobacter crystallopoietes BAB-32]
MSEVRPEQNDQPAPTPVLTAKQAKRANATVTGMLIALGLSIALFLPVFFLNPSSKSEVYERNINVAGVAQQAEGAAGYLPVAAELPEPWKANYARWNSGGSAKVPAWEVGYLTPNGQHIALVQTDQANPTWTAQQTENAPVTSDRQAGGETWELRDRGEGKKHLVLDKDGYTIILSGRGELDEFDTVAAAVVKALDTAPAK